MKRLVVILVVAVLAGIGTYQLVLSNADRPARNGADIAWLKDEFQLTDQQFEAIRELHRDYSTICTRHCADILAAREELEKLQVSGADAAVIAAARKRIKDLETICDDSTRDHLQQVARLMPPTEANRFLKLVEPYLANAPHDGARFPSP